MLAVLTIGTFAIPHMGHAAFLRASERFGVLTVGINSDAFVERYKGSRPLFNQDERSEIVASLGYRVVLNDGPGRELIEEIKPDILTIGTDWARKDYLAQIDVTQDLLDELRITLAYIPMRPCDISSSGIVKRIDQR